MNQSVVFFDGDCSLCNRMVQFILRRSHNFYFASLSSDYSQKLLKNRYSEVIALNTLVLYNNDEIYIKSDAVICICNKMTGLWPLFKIFRIIPVVILDKVYDLIANNRTKWLRHSNNCMYINSADKRIISE